PPRGHLTAPVRVGDVRTGTVFAPFHYGSWDQEDPTGRDPGQRHRAANELTLTEWDPVSKQPVFKTAAVRVTKVADATGPAPAPTTTASRPARGGRTDEAGGPAGPAGGGPSAGPGGARPGRAVPTPPPRPGGCPAGC
ncbi:molybdopterin dinucleotide binding domain-containing protein, partial [Kocuria sp. SM24M-10]|uniref:molybdopterin dinucleotide binding domain-containing protein n=1 Tax=Kocuria sp. SM24M-10 TaxID=1660349 RepID=UPI000A5648FD